MSSIIKSTGFHPIENTDLQCRAILRNFKYDKGGGSKILALICIDRNDNEYTNVFNIKESVAYLEINIINVEHAEKLTFSQNLKLTEHHSDLDQHSQSGVSVYHFYAPWCGHCKKLEPIWNHVAQTLYNTEIRTGKVDCTRFTGLATHFKIKGFPTIMFIKGDTYEFYKGDRTKEEIIGFALRMAATPVPHLDSSHLEHAIKDHNLFFLYSGLREGELWDSYYSLALYYRHFHFFYSTDAKSFGKVSKLESNPGV
ncbi:Protein disulfide-isomerase TMX3 [Armadillidium nasatum]|uniref:Protein disulfide-isomerase TMX3 n=1 Tax=Armadillidium nasatum TaxID=96803 RepID=A0A5N5SSP5_9CRUS|nr:Protein disulfide-isomerase TMX3 [Armadillidium nasatum]